MTLILVAELLRDMQHQWFDLMFAACHTPFFLIRLLVISDLRTYRLTIVNTNIDTMISP